MKVPIFRKTEIVVKDAYEDSKDSSKISLPEPEITEAIVEYIGLKCELGYDAGDTIMFYRKNANKLKLLGKNFLILPEIMVICQIEEA